jgi:NAD(P)-dependent dehydrogenase (short-subunit alcohol dehydrogenase family)
MGATLLLVGRNARAGQAVIERLRECPTSGTARFVKTDLSSLDEVRQLALLVRRHYRVIDVLVNNAGARFNNYESTSDGLERTFATNYLGHFLLTALLLERLCASGGGRIISVGSGAHASASTGETWFPDRERYDRKVAYAKSKLANIMFAYELARRLGGTAVTSNVVDPGGVATNLGRNNGLMAWGRHWLYYALKRELVSPRRAAGTLVHLASAPSAGGLTGKYLRQSQEIRSSSASYDRKAACQLWELSVRLTGLGPSLGDAWKYFNPAY